MPSKKSFTIKADIQKIKPPAKKAGAKGSVYDTYHDTRIDGLVLLVTNSGNKTFYVYKKFQGRPLKVIIGKFDVVYSLENARKEAKIILGKIASGINPLNEKRNLSNEITFKKLFDKYINEHAKLHTKSWQEDIDDVNRNLKHWYNRKLSTITPNEVRKLHAQKGIKTRIPGTNKFTGGEAGANRLLDRINAIFNKAIYWGWDGKNPASHVTKFKMKARTRFIQPDEFPMIWDVINSMPDTDIHDYFHLSLATGARRGNVRSMKWDEISWNRSEWHIEDTKNGESLIVPLLEDAIQILKRRKRRAKSAYVFAGTGKTGHIMDLKKGWKSVLKKAGLTDITIHDIRRTFGSYQTMLNANERIVGRSLGHKSRAATAVYSRLTLDPVRNSMTTAFDEMKKVGRE